MTKRGLKKKIIIPVVILTFVLTGTVLLYGWLKQGEYALRSSQCAWIKDVPGMTVHGTQVICDGQAYEYDDSNINILCMGVDARGEDVQVGQADMLALLVINTREKTLKCICINRDSIGPVVIYGVSGKPAAVQNVQVALAYAYGKNPEEGRDLEESTVSKLMYDLPIHGSVSLDIDGIGMMNSLAGGVTIEALEDVARAGISKGQRLTLNDLQAVYYVTERNSASAEIGTNENRIARQRQYMAAWGAAVVEKLKKNPLQIVDMYTAMDDYVSTGIQKKSMVYLAETLRDVEWTEDDIYTVPGSYERIDYYDRYIVDRKKLAEMMIDIFYRKVE